MEPKYYKDFFYVPVKYEPTMTREAINETADKWMDFYPHTTFIDLLKTLFDESKSVWITGNFGVGKSNATLVIQKLFMDDMSRVDKWFENNKDVITNSSTLRDKLAEAREEGTLVIYDYNASGINPHEEFLVRLEKGVLAALDEYGLLTPTKSNLDAVIDRLYREGENFFKTRDGMLGEMKSLKAEICSVDELAALLRKDDSAETPTHYLEDVEKVLHKDNIYLNIDVSSFRKWITDILRVNKLRRIVYIFDEFTDFVDENSGQLKTFEEVTEAPDVNHFYLVPVTHQEPTAFHGENAPGAKRTRDRFYFRNLSMPNDIAFKLAAHAMKPVKDPEIAIKWDAAKNQLWSSVRSVVDHFKDPPTSAAYVDHQSFFGILPIQPMAAFMLKFLAEHARSNQRSIFEYLKGSADGHEFQDFIATGGPDIAGAQLLTPDYLWKYFMERSDSGQSREITDIKLEYSRIVEREYKNYSDTADEIRILKTVMLFSLLSRLAPDGHERLAPTVENVELSFRGDGTIMDVRGILRDMSENKHCFSIVDGKIDLYTTTVGGDDLKKKENELTGQFYELIAPECKSAFEEHTKKARADFSSERFDIRVSDASHTTLTNITSTTRDKYSTGISKDDASICLWFVIAKDKSEQNLVSSRIASLLNQLRDHRIIMFSFPENTFCKDNANLWNEYVTLYAQYLLENSTKAKDQIKKSYTGITDKWIAALKGANTVIEVRYYDKNQSICEKYQWSQLKLFLQRYVERMLDACPDVLTDQITAFGNKGLKQWVLAGIRFSGIRPQSQLIDHLKANGVSLNDEWFDSHPEHIFSKIRKLIEKKYANTVGKGTELSLRKAYIELKRAPYGLRYNCLSAFTLGFCSAWILRKNCQWTNGQLTRPLDEETLAEIIESTVSDKTAKEKLICRLSKEDMKFAKYVGCMFGMPELETNPNPLNALENVSNKIQSTSMKVPLWILAEYIEKNKPQHKDAANVLNDLCTALRISSKGNSEEKSGAITEIGRKIIEEPEIIDIVSQYTTGETYIRAFQIYVDSVKPELGALAEKIGDHSHQYCDVILDDAALAAGWLWNKTDIAAIIDKTYIRYRFVESARDILKTDGYISYFDALNRLKAKIKELGLPYAIVGEKYPVLQKFISELNGVQDEAILFETFANSKSVIADLYNDPQKKSAVTLIREYAGDLKVDDKELANILSEISSENDNSVNMSADAYIKLIREAVDKNARNLIIKKAMKEWQRITGTDSIEEWNAQTRLPAWTVFANADEKGDLVRIFKAPKDFSTDALTQKLALLEAMPKIDVSICQSMFTAKIVPEKYKKLGIGLASLLKYLEDRYGNQPERWPENPDITSFINAQYQAEFAPKIIHALQEENADTLKNKILDIAGLDPDIGLKFLELLQ